MKFNKAINRIWIILLFFTSGCTGYQRMQADRHYENMAYHHAIEYYQKFIDSNPDRESLQRLAESYRKTGQIIPAENTYRKVVKIQGYPDWVNLRFGQILIQNGKTDEAKIYLNKYIARHPNEVVAKNLLNSTDSVKVYLGDTALWKLEKLPAQVNSGGSNFSPSFYKEGLVFTSERSPQPFIKENAWNGASYLDLFYIEKIGEDIWTAPEKIEGNINSIYHEGPLTFSPSGDTVFFTRSDYLHGKRGKDNDDINQLKLYQSVRSDGKWKKVKELPFNIDNYSTGHPAMSPDGKILIFVSDRPGGSGGTDLWLVEKKMFNIWSEPVNLGPDVNTPGNEMFPFVASDGTLYFSSDGLGGIGGLDVYQAKKNGVLWHNPLNMRSPINSNRDDFGFIIDKSSNQAYFSSNRRQSNQDEIFSAVWVEPIYRVEGVVVERNSQLPIKSAVVNLMKHTTGSIEGDVYTNRKGEFAFDLEKDFDYGVAGSKNGYFSHSENISTVGYRYSKTLYVKIELDSLVIGKPIVIRNIYYDYDKWFIREDAKPALNHLLKVLEDNPSIKIELSSHTDSRGSDKYNEKLSQKRAESAVNYLISRGIEPSRIIAKGYGESQLINKCGNDSECGEEEHQLNRRTEFKVLSK